MKPRRKQRVKHMKPTLLTKLVASTKPAKRKQIIIGAISSLIFSTAMLTACTNPYATTNATAMAINAPALRVNITTAAQKELQKTISNSLNLSSIGISPSALTQKNTVVIEKIKLLGFDLGTPTIFKLLKHKGQCILVNQNTKQRYHLAKTQCRVIQ